MVEVVDEHDGRPMAWASWSGRTVERLAERPHGLAPPSTPALASPTENDAVKDDRSLSIGPAGDNVTDDLVEPIVVSNRCGHWPERRIGPSVPAGI